VTPCEIRRLRFALGMRQDEFGRLLHAHASVVSRWENGVKRPDAWQISVMSFWRDHPPDTASSERAIALLAMGEIGKALTALFMSRLAPD